ARGCPRPSSAHRRSAVGPGGWRRDPLPPDPPAGPRAHGGTDRGSGARPPATAAAVPAGRRRQGWRASPRLRGSPAPRGAGQSATAAASSVRPWESPSLPSRAEDRPPCRFIGSRIDESVPRPFSYNLRRPGALYKPALAKEQTMLTLLVSLAVGGPPNG